MNEQERRLDLIGMHERRHFVVDVGSLPVGAILILKAEWRQSTIVSATARDAGLEEVAVSKEIDGHESAVGMTHHCDAISIDDTQANAFINGRFRAGDELLYVGVVGLRLPLSDDGNTCVFEDRIPLGDKRYWRTPIEENELVRRAGHLSRGSLGLVFGGVSFDKRGQGSILGFVPWRQVEICA